MLWETNDVELTVVDHLHVLRHGRAVDLRSPVQIKTLTDVQKSQLFGIYSQTLRAEFLPHNIQGFHELEVG